MKSLPINPMLKDTSNTTTVIQKEANPATASKSNKFLKWVKKLGFWGFMFFLIKGLLWLLIPYLIAKGFL